MSKLLPNFGKALLQSSAVTVTNANLLAATGVVAGMELSGFQTASMFAAGPEGRQQELVDNFTKLALANAEQQPTQMAEQSLNKNNIRNFDEENQSIAEKSLIETLSNIALNSTSSDQPNQDAESSDVKQDHADSINKDLGKLLEIDLHPLDASNSFSNLDGAVTQRVSSAASSDSSVTGSPQSVSSESHIYISAGNHGIVDGTYFNDTLIGSVGIDTLVGHGGDDVYYIKSSQTTILENVGEGHDSVISAFEGYKTFANIEMMAVDPSSQNYQTHTQAPDALLKNIDIGWHLFGNSIDQTLIGGNQSDVLNGMGGFDTLIGGAGDDVYYYSGTEKIIENSSQGRDIVRTSSSYTLGNNIEVAIAENNYSNINLVGNELSNIIIGNSSANTLTGNDGNDTLLGNGGEDLFIGGTGSDTFVLNSSESFVGEIQDFQAGQDKIVFSMTSSQQPSSLSFSDADFHGISGEVLLLDGMIEVDWNGDAVSDMLFLINSMPDIQDISIFDPSYLPGV